MPDPNMDAAAYGIYADTSIYPTVESWVAAGSPKKPGSDSSTEPTINYNQQYAMEYYLRLKQLKGDDVANAFLNGINDQNTDQDLENFASRLLDQNPDITPPAVKPTVFRTEIVTDPTGYDYEVSYDKDGNVLSRIAVGKTQMPSGKEKPDFTKSGQTRYRSDGMQEQYVISGGYGQWEEVPDSYNEKYDQQAIADKRQADLAQQKWQQQWNQQLAWYQQQQASDEAYRQQQAAAEKQKYTAQLAANPLTWMEYNAYTGQVPSVQPWMLPLMPQQYGQVQAGTPIPGWQGQAASSANGQPMTGLPSLTTPSMQYWSRLAPSSQAQYQSYQKTATGATPEDTAFRAWATAPPSGRNAPLSWVR